MEITESPQPEEETFILIPKVSLSEEALNGLIEEFILREGTDYGHSEATLEDKKNRVLKQLNSKMVQIVYSSSTGNTTLLRK